MSRLDPEKIARRKAESKELLRSSLQDMLPQRERLGAAKVVAFESLVE